MHASQNTVTRPTAHRAGCFRSTTNKLPQPAPGSFRALVLNALAGQAAFITGANVAIRTGLSYKQTIDALNALHRDGLVHRDGRKFTSLWGALSLAPCKTDHKQIQDVFHAFVTKKPMTQPDFHPPLVRNEVLRAGAQDADIAAFNALPIRERIACVTADMLREFGLDSTPPVKHTFCNGMYMREMFIPKGTVLIGKIHRHECLNICSSGDIDIVTENGSMRVGAGFSAVSAPHTQKIGYAFEDTVWVNVFKTDATDIDGIEDVLALTLAETIALLDPERKYFTKELTSCL